MDKNTTNKEEKINNNLIIENKNNKKENIIHKILNYFKPYELIWLFSIITIGIVLAIFLPDEDINGQLFLTIISLIALSSGMLCELLIAKQSKWNFIVSVVFVEVTEILICVFLGYYASASITLLFWIPIDIISFINWHKHADKEDNEITVVKKLSGKQYILFGLILVVFTVVVGYLLTLVGGEETYLDAFTSAIGMANGLFILWRFREQWIAWYIYAICEGILWVLAGQWVMLVLTCGYLINTTYGYIKWTKYINKKTEEKVKLN